MVAGTSLGLLSFMQTAAPAVQLCMMAALCGQCLPLGSLVMYVLRCSWQVQRVLFVAAVTQYLVEM